MRQGHRGRFQYKDTVSSVSYRKYHCGDQAVVRPSYLHNGISCTYKNASTWHRSVSCPWIWKDKTEMICSLWFVVYLVSNYLQQSWSRIQDNHCCEIEIPTNWFCLPLNSTSSKIYFKRLLWFTTIPELFDPMWPNDAVLWHIFWPILHQVIPCCLTAPSHYLNFWLFNHEVQWQSHEDNFTKSLHEPILTFLSILPLGTWHQDNSAINY